MNMRTVRSGGLRLLLVAFLLGTGGAGFGEEPSPKLPAGVTDRIDALFAKWNRPDSPGCSVGIVRDGQLIYGKGFGSASLEYQAPNTTRTVFETASFGKS